MDIKRIIKKYTTQLYDRKFDVLHEMNQIFEINSLTKLTQEEKSE